MPGYEQLCRVTGRRVAGARDRLDCLGQRGHSWGAPDWERIARARTVSVWLDDELALSLVAIAPTAASGSPDAEAISAACSPARHAGDDERRGPPPADRARRARAAPVDSVRQRRPPAARRLELFDPDGHPRRGAGEARCGTSLDLGALRLDCAFFTWRMEGREGVGRYDVLSRA